MKKLPNSQIEFENQIPQKDWEKFLDSAAAEASKEIKIEGFRPGKAPRNIIEQKIGKDAILNLAAEKAVKKHYVDFVVKEKIDVIGSPKIEILEVEEGKDLKYKVIVSVMPEIEVKKSYISEIKKINKNFNEKKVEVDPKEIDLEIEKLANSRVKLVTVNREAQKNDSVEIDFHVLVDGVPIEGGTSKKHPMIIGRGVFIPGFEEQLIGMKAEEEKEFELNFPKEYHKKDLAGRPATFKVKMLLVQDRQIPEINDKFAASLGKFKNLKELKKSIKDGMKHEKEHKMKDEKRTAYLDEIIKVSASDLPEILIEEEIAKMFSEFEQQLAPMGMGVDQYLAQIKKERKDLEKDWKPQAEKRIMSALALSEIAKMEEISPKKEEVEAEMNKVMQYYKNIKDAEKNIDMKRLYNYSKSVLQNEKVFEFLEKL